MSYETRRSSSAGRTLPEEQSFKYQKKLECLREKAEQEERMRLKESLGTEEFDELLNDLRSRGGSEEIIDRFRDRLVLLEDRLNRLEDEENRNLGRVIRRSGDSTQEYGKVWIEILRENIKSKVSGEDLTHLNYILDELKKFL